jgi:hypothetical protein
MFQYALVKIVHDDIFGGINGRTGTLALFQRGQGSLVRTPADLGVDVFINPWIGSAGKQQNADSADSQTPFSAYHLAIRLLTA